MSTLKELTGNANLKLRGDDLYGCIKHFVKNFLIHHTLLDSDSFFLFITILSEFTPIYYVLVLCPLDV